MAAEIETTTIAVGDLHFDALVAGPEDGEVVLLLHGFPQGARVWRPVMPSLVEDGFRVVAFDQRGYSPGARPTGNDEDYAMPALVDDVVGVIVDIGADQVHLVGHDWGGSVAWNVAGRHPELVRTLTVLSTPHPDALRAAIFGELGGEQPNSSAYLLTFMAEGTAEALAADGAAGFRAVFEAGGLDAEDAEPYVEALGSAEALDAILAWYRAAGIGREPLPPITVPTLFLWGADDPVMRREGVEASGQYVTGPYRLSVLEGVGHWIVEQAGDQACGRLREHLAIAGL